MKRILFICVSLLPFMMAMGSNNVLSESEGPVADVTPNTTIAEFKAKHWQDALNYIDTVKENEVIHGWITSSDESGNIYKTLYIRDESGAGLAISINQRDLYQMYAPGQEIVLSMKDCFIGKYNGMQQIGYPQYYARDNCWEATFLPQAVWESIVQLNGYPDTGMIEPVDVSLDDFADKADVATMLAYQGKLVRLSRVRFAEADGVVTYSEPNSTTNRILVDADGNELIVRNSNYADFAQEALPTGEVTVVGVLGVYKTQWQLFLRDFNDVTDGTSTAVDEISGSKAVAGVKYYNLAGQEMGDANGVCIAVTTYTDGTTSAAKVMK